MHEPPPSLFDQAAPPIAPDVARARTTDPETSHEAATVTNTNALQRRVLVLLMSGARTDEELLDLHRAGWPDTPVSPSGLRSRRAELVRMGYVEFADEHRTTAAGRRTRVWCITFEGQTAGEAAVITAALEAVVA